MLPEFSGVDEVKFGVTITHLSTNEL